MKASGARAARSTSSTSSTSSSSSATARVYFVDDHFLLQPKRIEAICKGINDAGITIQWGCEGRVDSTAQHLFPAWPRPTAARSCSASRAAARRCSIGLKKEQTLAEVETAVTNAKQAGIEIVHGFFVVGTPGRDRRGHARHLRLRGHACGSTPSGSTACASTAARRSGRSTSSAAWSTTPTIGTSTSSARRSIPPACRAR